MECIWRERQDYICRQLLLPNYYATGVNQVSKQKIPAGFDRWWWTALRVLCSIHTYMAKYTESYKNKQSLSAGLLDFKALLTSKSLLSPGKHQELAQPPRSSLPSHPCSQMKYVAGCGQERKGKVTCLQCGQQGDQDPSVKWYRLSPQHKSTGIQSLRESTEDPI